MDRDAESLTSLTALTVEPDRVRTLALNDAHKHLRLAKAALVVAAADEPQPARAVDLSAVQAVIADAEVELARLRR